MVKILFLAANPCNLTDLKLKEEYQAIDVALRTAKFADQFTLIPVWAVRANELQDVLRRYEPQIVHFCGHGSATSELYVEDQEHQAHPISPQALEELFRLLRGKIRCVVLNACYSEQQANAIANHIDGVVGMSGAVQDNSALNFAIAFYQALAAGESLQASFDCGCLEIDLNNLGQRHTPQLIARRIAPDHLTFVTDAAINPRSASSVELHHNLAGLDFPNLVGRQQELATIQAWLHPTSHHRIIAIQGIGGIGKSTLALAIAHHYRTHYSLLQPGERFEAIVWASAKLTEYRVTGPQSTLHPRTTLDRIYSAISVVLEDEAITRADEEQRDEIVKRALIHTRTLLIVDNLETVTDPKVFAFLAELPAPSKAIVTTRSDSKEWPAHLQLNPFSRSEIDIYLDQWPQARACLNQYHMDQFRKRMGGIPLALRLCFSVIEDEADFDWWFVQLTNKTGENLVWFCVHSNWTRLQQESALAGTILKVLTLFDLDWGGTPALLATLLALPDPNRTVLPQLRRITDQSLANRTTDGRYTVQPVVRQYVMNFLSTEERNLWRQRQLQSYLDHLLKPYIVHIDFVCGTATVLNDAKEIDNLELVLEWAQTHASTSDYLKFADGFSSLLYLVGFVNRAIAVASAALSIAQQQQDQARQYDFHNKLALYRTWSDKFTAAEQSLRTAMDLSELLLDYRRDNVLDYYGAYLMRKDAGLHLFAAYEPLSASAALRERFVAPDQDQRVAVLGRFLMGVWYYRVTVKFRTKTSFLPEDVALLEKLALAPTQSSTEITAAILAHAEEWLSKGLALAETLDFERGCSYILNYLGNIYILHQDWEQAEKALMLALQLAERVVDRRRIARVQQSLFHLFAAQGKTSEAQQWATQALERFTSLGMTQEEKELQDGLKRLAR